MMNPVPWLQMTNMISYQGLVRTFLNIYTGAYYLAQAFKKWGVSWDAVGAYNAGFKKTPRQAARRYEYAKKIHYYYTAIKASKRTSSKDQKIAMN